MQVTDGAAAEARTGLNSEAICPVDSAERRGSLDQAAGGKCPYIFRAGK
jgi:hypothetical protein